MLYFVLLSHPVTTFVTAFNNHDKLTYDLLIFKLIDNFKVDCITLSVRMISRKNIGIVWCTFNIVGWEHQLDASTESV